MFRNFLVSTKRSRGRILVSSVLLCLILSVSAFAQNSSVGGTVLDPSAALIPGVTVNATNTDTGVTATTITNESGAYNFAGLQPGPYRLSASLPGFQTQTFNNYRVGAGETLRLNFTLQLAQTQSQVEVSVDATNILQTSSSSIGQVLTPTKVQELPLIGTDVLQLIDILPGVVGENFAGVSQSQVNTIRDGLSVSDGRFNAGVFATTVMNPDLVGEVRLILAPVDAELGRGNGQVVITTRSGTNRFNGSAVWNVRNTALNPNTWGNNNDVDPATGLWSPTQPNWENNHEYTLSYGGPIIRNKTFFFALFNQNMNWQRQVINADALTPTARRGIFRYFPGWENGDADTNTNTTGNNPTRAVVDFSGNPLPITLRPDGVTPTGLTCFSIFGNVEVDGSPFDASDCPGGTAIINPGPWDTNRTVIDPTGYIRRILDEMPQVNAYTGGGDGLNRAVYRYLRGRQGNQGGNVTIGNDLNANRWQINFKVDHNFNNNHKLSVGYTKEQTSTFSDVPDWPNQITYRTKRWPQVLTTNFTSTLSSNLLNEARFGIRYNDAGIDAPWEETFGNDAVIERARSWTVPIGDNFTLITPGAGNYNFGGSTNGVMITNPGQYNGNKSKLFSWGDTLSWTKGVHAFKFGGEYRRDESNGFNNVPAGGGALILYPRMTGGAGGNTAVALANTNASLPGMVANMRTDAANMLYFFAGSVNSVSQSYWINSYQDVVNGTWHDTTDLSTNRRKYRPVARGEYSFFVKDDWKITRRLTLNLGARYEFYGEPYISSGFTSTVIGQGVGLFGVGRASGELFSQWLRPGSLFLSGYGSGAAAADALKCTTGVANPNGIPTSNCNPDFTTQIEFIGPGTPNPDKVAIRQDRNNFGPAVGFAYQLPWFGEGKTTIRGGYQISYGGSGRVVGGGGTTADETVVGAAPGSQSSPTTVLADFNGEYLDLTDIPRLVPVNPFSPALPGGTVAFHTRAGNFSAYDPNFVTPYTQNITLSINRAVTSKINVDIQYIGTLSRKQSGSLNINATNVFNNPQLMEALTQTRRGENSLLLDQMLAGLNLNSGVAGYGAIGTCVTQPTGSTAPGLGLEGCAANQVRQHASAHLRRNTTFQANIADGNFNGVAVSLNGNGSSLPTAPAAGSLVPSPLTSTGGRLLRNGCDRLASGQTLIGNVTPVCFPENFITANPQIGTPTYITNSASSNYHSLQTQFTMRPTNGFSYQATYTWSKNLGTPGNNYTDPMNRGADYTYTAAHRSHDFRSNGSFELPIGPNKLLLSNASGWFARVVEGWQMNLILNLTAGDRDDVAANSMLYRTGANQNGTPDIVRPTDFKGGVVWGGSSTANGQLTGDYFGAGTFIKVPDPQCAQTAIPDNMGFNISSSCSIDALADANGNIVLQHPQPGKPGTLGQNVVEMPGTWRFDANMGKTFRIAESKTLQVRFDATNVLNHPQPGDPQLSINSNTPFGNITTKTGTRTFQGQLRLSF